MSRAEKMIGHAFTIAPLAVVVLFAHLMGEQERELLALREAVANTKPSKAAACNLDQFHVLDSQTVHDQAEGSNKRTGLHHEDLARCGDFRSCSGVSNLHLGAGVNLCDVNLGLRLVPGSFALCLNKGGEPSVHHRSDILAADALLRDGFVQGLASVVHVNWPIGGVQ